MHETADDIFDASRYALPIPALDGLKADKLSVSLTGTVDLDRTSVDDLELAEALRLGGNVELLVRASVAVKRFTHATRGDDQHVAYSATLRVTSLEAA